MTNDKLKISNVSDPKKLRDADFLESIVGPDWLTALEELECKENPKVLGQFLQNHIPPAWVAKEIGKMLLSPKGYRGVKLKLVLPDLSRQEAFDRLKEKRDVFLRIKKLEDDGWQTEAALTQIMTETGYSRASLFKIKRIDFEQEFNLILGNEIESRKR
jgi:hypothetical protein